MRIVLQRICLSLFAVTLGCSTVFANGFKILCVKSTRATSMGEAFIVQADDPSAVAFNPAGVARLDGTRLSVGLTYTTAWLKHTSPAGVTEHMKDTWQTVPNIFLTSDLGGKKTSFGLGITVPNGLSSEWRDTGFARYVSTFSDLRVIDLNPCLAWKLRENLSLGVGVSYYMSEVALESMVDYGLLAAAPGTMDGSREMEGDGNSWGFNLGVIYDVNDRHGLAATYKHAYRVDYSGDLVLSDIPAFLGVGTSYRSGLESSIEFPAVVVLGYAYRPSERVKVEFNLDWTNGDVMNSLDVDVDTPLPPLVPANFTLAYDYDDTIAYKFGLEYDVRENWKLRAGFIYNENATPEETFRPSLPDTETKFLTMGLGYRKGRLEIDSAFQIVTYDDRDVDNNVDLNETISSSSIDGEYDNIAIGYCITVTYRF